MSRFFNVLFFFLTCKSLPLSETEYALPNFPNVEYASYGPRYSDYSYNNGLSYINLGPLMNNNDQSGRNGPLVRGVPGRDTVETEQTNWFRLII